MAGYRGTKREEWEERLSRFENAGTTVAKFCAAEATPTTAAKTITSQQADSISLTASTPSNPTVLLYAYVAPEPSSGVDSEIHVNSSGPVIRVG